MTESTLEAELQKCGFLIYSNVGTSMLPLIRQGRDLMIIRKKDPACRCRKYDVILYRRPDGKQVLHRILRGRKEDYVLCGDNQWFRETGVKEDWILGVLTGVIRDGKEVSVSTAGYRIYTHLWCDFFWIRAFFLRSAHIVRRLRKKLSH